MPPTGLSSRILSSLAFALFSCAGAPARPTAAAVQVRPAAVPPSRVELASALEEPRLLGTLPDGRHAVAVHGMRLAVARDGVEAAPDVIARGIVGAVVTEAGWRFVDQSGARWQATSFLGPLERAGVGIEGSFRPTHSAGIVAILRGETRDELHVTDGSAEPRLALDLPVQGASFLDARNGLAVVLGGLLARTADGGRTWERVAAPVAAHDVSHWGTHWRVSLPLDAEAGAEARRRALDVFPDGRTAELEVEPLATPEWVGDVLELFVALFRVAPGMLTSMSSLPFVGDAFVVGAGADFPDLLRFDSHGRLVERIARGARDRPVEAAGLPASSCSLRRWGARVLATCGARGSDGGSGDDEHANLYVSDDGRQFRPLLDVRASTHDVRAGADGRALAWVSGDNVHVWTDAGAVVVPVGTECRGRLLAVHGERVVLAGRQSPICVLDVERRSIAPMQTSERIEDVHAETTSEGALLVCGNYEPEGDRPKVHRCWRSLDGGALQVMPLPEGTRAVSMVDASRAMALGATLANAWRTDDGGARWTPLAIPGVVGAERIELASANRDARPSLACFPERCVIGPNFFSGSTVAVTVWGWGAPTPGSLRLLATDPLRFAGGAAATESPPMLRVRCEATPGRPPRVREPRPAPEGSDVWIGGGGGAFARLVVAAGDEPSRTGTLQWWGHDERGAWSVASRPVDVAAHLPPSTRGSSTRLVTSVLTRTTALVELCADGCTTFFARPGRPLVAVPTIRGRAYDPDLGIALADGGVARAVGDYPATRVHILDGEGRVSRTVDRAIPFAPDRLRALTDTADALVHPVARRGWIALPLDDTRMPTRASSSDAPLRACTAPRAADARTVHVGTGSDVRGLASSQPRAVVELTASGACVRTLEIWPAAGAMADAPSSGRLTAGTDGVFTGWIASDRGERGTYRCTLDGTGGTTPP